MRHTEVYALLILKGSSPTAIAKKLRVDPSLVRRRIRGERLRGKDAKRVEAELCEILDIEPSDLPGSCETKAAA